MINLSPEIGTALLFLGVVIGIVSGYPIGLAIGSAAIIIGYTVWGPAIVEVVYVRAMSAFLNYVLLAVPLFIFMGVMLSSSGLAERMFEAFYIAFGKVRGGLAVITVAIGTILAACVGTITAEVTMLTLVALPSMVKRGYSKALASGSICAGGCLGILIPPSVMLVLYGPMAEVSVGRLFMGAFGPGLTLSALYITYILSRAFLRPSDAPAIPKGDMVQMPFIKMTLMLSKALLPPALLILAVLGSIFFGIAAPTEAAAMGCLAATLLATAWRKFNFRVLKEVTILTLRYSGFIYLLIAAGMFFASVFSAVGGAEVVSRPILAAPGGVWGSLAVILFIIFILGMFMSWIPIVLIMVPIVTPISDILGFDAVWFSIMVCLTLQSAFLSPPFAPAIFVLAGTADPALEVRVMHVIRGVIPFIIIIIVTIVLCILFPEIITWLPNQMIRGF